MGLGKTVQVSVMISALILSKQLRDTIIIAPHSLLEYWETEFKHWCGSANPAFIRIRRYKETFIYDQFRINERRPRIIVITTNAFTELLPKLREKLSVDLLVVDEGHKAKNINTKIRDAIRNFPVNRIKLVLTGTPVQNNLKELYSLLDIV